MKFYVVKTQEITQKDHDEAKASGAKYILHFTREKAEAYIKEISRKVASMGENDDVSFVEFAVSQVLRETYPDLT